MVNRGAAICCLVLCVLSGGCSRSGPGLLYINVTLPYSTDFNDTPVGTRQCILKAHQVKEPMTGYGVTIEWSSDQIQSAAHKAGISNIRYMDIQTISFVLGFYTRRQLIIYGD